MTYILALDQGTSSSRAIIYRPDGSVVGHAQETFDMEFPNPGWVEQDPQAIWHTTLNSAHKALVETDLTAKDVTAIGITNQRETTLVWDRQTGECVYNAIVWQDSRTAERCNEIRLEQLGDQFLGAFRQDCIRVSG